MAIIPEEKLLEIKDAAPIEEVVGQYVKLQQRGKNLLGLCPFHSDSKPSFNVSPERGIFKCFGCGVGGNVFHFLMQYHRLSFVEAVQELGRRYGIAVSLKDMGPDGARQARQRASAYDINQAAMAFFEANLKASDGQAARDYIAKRRLTPEVVSAFHLGYASDDWEALKRHLQSRGLPLEVARELGLVKPRDKGGYYDGFRNRLMFPIQDRTGRVIAFGGRIIGEGEPKYLNSPESQLYHKARQLYGVPQAQEALRHTGTALVVEGYLDLIALQVHGVANVVAGLGTALTREQVRLLKNLVPRVVLVYDGDAAGVKAMLRAFPLFAQEGLAVRALPLPAGQDPDTYAFSHGVELFQDAWDKAHPWFNYLLEQLILTHGEDVEGRVRIFQELRPYYQVVKDPVEQDLWLKAAAQRLGVDEAAVRRSLSSMAPLAPGRLDPAGRVAINLEKELVGFILKFPDAAPLAELTEWAAEVQDPEYRRLLGLIVQCLEQHNRLDYGLLVQQVEGERLREQVCAMTLAEQEADASEADAVTDAWRRDLHMRRLKRTRDRLKDDLAAIMKGGDEAALLALLAQRQELDRQLEDLKRPDTGKGD
jgi:DNA primase